MAKKGTVFCERCDKQFLPSKSTAEDPEIYCSQACEVADDIEDSQESGDLDFEHEDD
jgi:hypothetical protein